MRVTFLTAVIAALLSVYTGQTFAAEPTAAGLWQAVDDDTHQPNAWFLVQDHNGVFDGTIVRMFLKPGDDTNAACDGCKDDRHGKPWLGLDIVRGMRRDGLSYRDGTIVDPRNGSVYSAEMTLTPDNMTLIVRGYLGISLLGKNQYWTRLPDTAFNEIDPRFNPNPPPPAAAAPGRKSGTPAKPASGQTNR
jgi:uncharacterized protein (DUF2147 family)